MDDATQRWLTDVEILDAMLALASDLSQDAVRRSVADSLRGAARSVVPAGVAVGVAASSDGR